MGLASRYGEDGAAKIFEIQGIKEDVHVIIKTELSNFGLDAKTKYRLSVYEDKYKENQTIVHISFEADFDNVALIEKINNEINLHAYEVWDDFEFTEYKTVETRNSLKTFLKKNSDNWDWDWD